MQTLSKAYDTYATARKVVEELQNAGIARDSISLLGHNGTNATIDGTDVDNAAEGAESGAGIGGLLGGGAGLLAGLGLLAIPGLGPIVAAGWLASTAAGAVAGAAAGAATGGIIGLLTENGFTEEDANLYAENLRRGGALVSVRVENADSARVAAILDRHTPVDLRTRSEAWRKEGWQKFDPNAKPYANEQIARKHAS